MKIIVDKNIPFLKGIVEAYGEVHYLLGSEFTKESIRDADTLIVRTITRLDKNILEGSNVKLICSATAGIDHIDIDYCKSKGIAWRNAPGCNSSSVQQYIASVLALLAEQGGYEYRKKTIGIIGVGNVGKKVSYICKLLGMDVLLNDPIRKEIEADNSLFVDIKTIQENSDIISVHTPLSRDGEYPTFHMLDDSFFLGLKRNPIFINSARGPVVDTYAIKEAIVNKVISKAIIDCWENEPKIDLHYMKMTDIATPHIAGYAADSKANASRMALEALAEFWGLDKQPISEIKAPAANNPIIDYSTIKGNKIHQILLKTYNPLDDFERLIRNPELFSQLRGNYPLRREYPAYTITNISDKDDLKLLESLGFNIERK